MNRKRTVAAGTLGFGVLALVAVACGGGDDNAGGDDSSATDSGPGTDSTVETDSSPPADTGVPDTGPFCNTTPCVTSLGVGGLHSCALISDGTVRCWGGNLFGALGSGTVIDGGTVNPPLSASPLAVNGLASAVEVTGGGYYGGDIGFTCALHANKTLDCWGSNQLAGLGQGDASFPSGPQPLSTLLTNAVDVSAGLYSSCAALSSGDVTCWGNNVLGQINPPAESLFYPSPTVLSAGGTKFTKVSVGYANACAITDDAHVWCWGTTANGETGHYTDGGAQDSIPAPVQGIDSVANVAAGFEAGCAVKTDGSLLCWGYNAANILGRGTVDAGPFDPVPGATAAPAGMKFKQVVSHAAGFCALATDGTVWCWGENEFGVNGSGVADSGAVTPLITEGPTQVAGLTDVIQLSSNAIGFHTCALINGGAVKCWGYNQLDQLGVAPADGGDPFSIAPLTVTF